MRHIGRKPMKEREALMKLLALWKPCVVGLVITFAFCIIVSSLVSAQGSGYRIGVVRMRTVQRDFNEYQKAMEQIEEQRRSYERQLAQLRSYPFLTAEEAEELLKLHSKGQLGESERRRELELRGLHSQRADEFQKLSSIQQENLTPAQQQRLKELRAIAQANAIRHNKLLEEFQRKLDSLGEQTRNYVDKRIREAVSQVAKEQNLDMVLDRDAVLFVRGELIDVTAQILKKLNEGK